MPPASRRTFLGLGGGALASAALTRAEAPAPLALDAEALAAELRALYAGAGAAWERWGGRAAPVRLPDGRELPREEAWRDHPQFVAAARLLLRSPRADDAALGAWLLGSAPAAARAEAARAALDGLGSPQALAAFEAARSLAGLGDAGVVEALRHRLPGLPVGPVRTAAATALERLTG